MSDNAGADTIYRAVVAGQPSDTDAAIAWFYIGALAERFGYPSQALDAYANSIQLDASSALADDAYWWRALILQDSGQPIAAAAEFDALAAEYPGSPFAYDAVLEAALIHHRRGNDDVAASRLRSMVATMPAHGAALAALWLRSLGLAREDDPSRGTSIRHRWERYWTLPGHWQPRLFSQKR